MKFRSFYMLHNSIKKVEALPTQFLQDCTTPAEVNRCILIRQKIPKSAANSWPEVRQIEIAEFCYKDSCGSRGLKMRSLQGRIGRPELDQVRAPD